MRRLSAAYKSALAEEGSLGYILVEIQFRVCGTKYYCADASRVSGSSEVYECLESISSIDSAVDVTPFKPTTSYTNVDVVLLTYEMPDLRRVLLVDPMLNAAVLIYHFFGDFVIGSTGNVYDTVFEGIVSNAPDSSAGGKVVIRCADKFYKYNRLVPPVVVTKEMFPRAIKESYGLPIPVVIGDVMNCPLLLVEAPGVTKLSRPLGPGVVSKISVYDSLNFLDISPTLVIWNVVGSFFIGATISAQSFSIAHIPTFEWPKTGGLWVENTKTLIVYGAYQPGLQIFSECKIVAGDSYVPTGSIILLCGAVSIGAELVVHYGQYPQSHELQVACRDLLGYYGDDGSGNPTTHPAGTTVRDILGDIVYVASGDLVRAEDSETPSACKSIENLMGFIGASSLKLEEVVRVEVNKKDTDLVPGYVFASVRLKQFFVASMSKEIVVPLGGYLAENFENSAFAFDSTSTNGADVSTAATTQEVYSRAGLIPQYTGWESDIGRVTEITAVLYFGHIGVNHIRTLRVTCNDVTEIKTITTSAMSEADFDDYSKYNIEMVSIEKKDGFSGVISVDFLTEAPYVWRGIHCSHIRSATEVYFGQDDGIISKFDGVTTTNICSILAAGEDPSDRFIADLWSDGTDVWFVTGHWDFREFHAKAFRYTASTNTFTELTHNALVQISKRRFEDKYLPMPSLVEGVSATEIYFAGEIGLLLSTGSSINTEPVFKYRSISYNGNDMFNGIGRLYTLDFFKKIGSNYYAGGTARIEPSASVIVGYFMTSADGITWTTYVDRTSVENYITANHWTWAAARDPRYEYSLVGLTEPCKDVFGDSAGNIFVQSGGSIYKFSGGVFEFRYMTVTAACAVGTTDHVGMMGSLPVLTVNGGSGSPESRLFDGANYVGSLATLAPVSSTMVYVVGRRGLLQLDTAEMTSIEEDIRRSPTYGPVRVNGMSVVVSYTPEEKDASGTVENLRVVADVVGWVDDAEGIYTGNPYAVVDKPCDIVRFLGKRFCRIQEDDLEVEDLPQVREWMERRRLGGYMDTQKYFLEIVSDLAQQGYFRVDMDGGKLRILPGDRNTSPVVTITQ